jgi:hypothetical protein
MQAQRVNRGTALFILSLGVRLAKVVNATPRPFYPRAGAPVPIVQEAGWVLGPGWTGMEKRKLLTATEV